MSCDDKRMVVTYSKEGAEENDKSATVTNITPFTIVYNRILFDYISTRARFRRSSAATRFYAMNSSWPGFRPRGTGGRPLLPERQRY